ncbi:MAG: SprB repeat-containing protein [Saprospiraceae bacterium]|nr:SprB repeat-containing protein [Saprospiraceae bacterium]
MKFKADGTPTVVTMNFTDDPSCSDTKTGPTVQPCPTLCDLAITNVTASPENCPGANNGSITVTATTSTGPLTYAISGPANQSNNTGVFTGLPDGNYSITVTDNGVANCTATSAATVAAGVDNVAPMPVCRNTTVTLNATGNYTLTAADVFN